MERSDARKRLAERANEDTTVDLDLTVAVRHELIEHVLGLDAESVVDRVILPLRDELKAGGTRGHGDSDNDSEVPFCAAGDTTVESTAQYIRRLCEENQELRRQLGVANKQRDEWRKTAAEQTRLERERAEAAENHRRSVEDELDKLGDDLEAMVEKWQTNFDGDLGQAIADTRKLLNLDGDGV